MDLKDLLLERGPQLALAFLAAKQGGPEAVSGLLEGVRLAQQRKDALTHQAAIEAQRQQDRRLSQGLQLATLERGEASDAYHRLMEVSARLQALTPQLAETTGDPLAAQNAFVGQQHLYEQLAGAQPGTLGPLLPNMAQAVTRADRARAQRALDRIEKAHPGVDPADLDRVEGELDTGERLLVGEMRRRAGAQLTQPGTSTPARLTPALTPDRTPPTVGSFEDFLTATPERQAEIARARARYTAAGREVTVNPAAAADIDEQAELLMAGLIVPSMLSKRSGSFNAVLAKASRVNRARTGHALDFVKLQTDFTAAQRFVASLNGSQMIRFLGLGKSVVNTIDEVNRLADELKQDGVQLFNRAKRGTILQLYGNTPQSATAAQYLAAVNTLREEFANLVNGGYAPTEPAFALANSQVNMDFGVRDLQASLLEVQRLINYRLGAFNELQPQGLGGAIGPASTPPLVRSPTVEEWIRDPVTGQLRKR